MKSKNILFTFDYELFLGRKSGNAENCILKPTNEVVKILDEYNLKGIFFIDCTYLYELKKISSKYPRAKDDFTKISDQIKNLIRTGHFIYPHIHSHWVDSAYNHITNEWQLTNINKYRLSSLNDTEGQRIFYDSYFCLLEIVKSANKDFSMNAYRAGGWCIQPFSTFEPIFRELGIIADFSVLGGSKKHTNTVKFDFTKIKPNSEPYRFEKEETEITDNGDFLEFPISSIKLNKKSIVKRVIEKVIWETSLGKPYGNGVGVPFDNHISPTNYDLEWELISIEVMSVYKQSFYKQFLKNNDFMHFISHPKMMSKHNLTMFRKFVKFATKNYQINSDWTKIKVH